MNTRRLSTLTFGRLAAAQLENGVKLREALNLAMIVEPLNTMDAHDCARFFLLGPFQTFKSLVGQLRLLRNHCVRPRPALWYSPTEDFGKDFADTKLNLLFDALPDTRALLHDDRSKAGKLRKILTGGASHLILSANTENDRHGKTACDIYRDESHIYEPDWIPQTSNRRGAYPEEFTETDLSTGLIAGTDAANIWATTTQSTWHCRCPKCEQIFEPRYSHKHPDTQEIIGGLRYTKAFDSNGLPDEQAIARTLRYECPHCHAEFPDTIGSRLAFSGTAAQPRGLYIPANKSPALRCFGWTFHGIAVRPWLSIVIRFELAMLAMKRGDLEPLAKWIREECGGIWDPSEHWKDQKLRPTGDYAMGEDWIATDTDPGEAKDEQGNPWRFAGIDVQLDHFVLTSRKWGKDSRSRLHWAEKITTAGILADRLATLKVMPERTFLDARHTPERVRRLCSVYGWRSLMGEGEKSYPHAALGGIRRIFSEPIPMDPWHGTEKQGRSSHFEFKFSKPSALERLHLLRTLETNDAKPLWTGAKDAPEWYWKEIDAFHRIRKQAENGSVYYEFAQHGPDHAADGESMGIVGASMVGLIGAESLETPVSTEEEKKAA